MHLNIPLAAEYRRLGGASPACPTPRNREIGFVSVASLFRACRACGRGKAVHVCVRRASPTLGLGSAEKSRLRALWGAIVADRKRWFYQLLVLKLSLWV